MVSILGPPPVQRRRLRDAQIHAYYPRNQDLRKHYVRPQAAWPSARRERPEFTRRNDGQKPEKIGIPGTKRGLTVLFLPC
jgi:hypothetical protein